MARYSDIVGKVVNGVRKDFLTADDVSSGDIAGGSTTTSSSTDITLTSASTLCQNITTTASNLKVILPNATTLNEGLNYIIANNGSNKFYIFDNDLNYLQQVNVGECYFVILDDNSDAAGTWKIYGFDANTKELADFIGNPTIFESASSYYISVSTLSSDKAIVCYQDSGNSNYGTALTIGI